MEVVAQLVRASVCGTEGRGFETRLPPILKRLIKFGLFYFCKLLEKILISIPIKMLFLIWENI